ncbi:response regulator [Wenzhouxiangella sp. XN201]|uniref:GGDEF domain-containing response regulator n=1 Tax=Wenzhouxiangella sp. XN201 TaxID=2710755 RepID=UPI0013CB8DA2|nr:response regulator [Wenzhouxiangella sp. XN201]NEZ02921.1 response regulator [Wenzhouxiangella sp. XN201]
MSVATDHQTVRPRILFVDDSRLMRACAVRILGQDFDLALAESAEQAWELLQTDREIQAVFSDLFMTGKSGLDLLKQMRTSERRELADMPMVLITGEEDGEKRRRDALGLGATDFISKPFQASELMARARAYARTGESSRRLRLLEQDHHVDTESGVGNRRYLEERLLQAMSFAHRHQQPLAMMHLRLDGLTELLEDLGRTHAARAMGRIGETLSRRIRREDTVFRSGEECFTFLLPATTAEGAETLKSRFLPDLDELGLGTDEAALAVRPGFVVQVPPPPNGRDAAQIIDEGLAGETVPVQPSRNEPSLPDLEQALRMIERGDQDQLRPFLARLEQQLRPLIEAIEAGKRQGFRRESRRPWDRLD